MGCVGDGVIGVRPSGSGGLSWSALWGLDTQPVWLCGIGMGIAWRRYGIPGVEEGASKHWATLCYRRYAVGT